MVVEKAGETRGSGRARTVQRLRMTVNIVVHSGSDLEVYRIQGGDVAYIPSDPDVGLVPFAEAVHALHIVAEMFACHHVQVCSLLEGADILCGQVRRLAFVRRQA